jgi:hypothetical protein
MMCPGPFVLQQHSVSYLIVLCVVAVEALNLVLLWIALRRAGISRLVRPLIAGIGLSGAWGAWILVLVLRGPLLMMVVTGCFLALSSVAMGIAIYLATAEEEEHLDGGGGGAPTASPEGPDGGGNDEPLWWPEFQRQIDAYATQREREPQPVDC